METNVNIKDRERENEIDIGGINFLSNHWHWLFHDTRVNSPYLPKSHSSESERRMMMGAWCTNINRFRHRHRHTHIHTRMYAAFTKISDQEILIRDGKSQNVCKAIMSTDCDEHNKWASKYIDESPSFISFHFILLISHWVWEWTRWGEKDLGWFWNDDDIWYFHRIHSLSLIMGDTALWYMIISHETCTECAWAG